MSLYATLKLNRNLARGKNESAFNVLTVLVGELELESKRKGIEPSDEDVTRMAKKFYVANSEVIQLSTKDDVKSSLAEENKALEAFIPVQLSESELRALYEESGVENVKEFMAFLKKNYAGKYDGKLASSVAQEALKKVTS